MPQGDVKLPVNESIGVFVSVAGFDWLANGRAEPVKAILAALVAGLVIMLTRLWRKKRQRY